MPHCVVLYTPNVDADMTEVCRALADAMLAVRDEGRRVFPIGGTRVLAFPAAHFAVADGNADYAFVYANVRMAPGRSASAKSEAGDALLAALKRVLAPTLERLPLGITVQIDESTGQVYDGKHSTLHPLFA